jgi:hypothetical protein
VGFFHFEIGNAVAQQAAHTVIFFKHGDLMAYPSQLLGELLEAPTRYVPSNQADGK